MNNQSTSTSYSAAPGPSGRPAATSFNALPPQQMPPHPRNFPTRGRNALRSRTPSYAPRRQPKEPQLPVAFAAGGRALPNSESRTLGRAEPNIVNPRNFPTRGRNASRSRTPNPSRTPNVPRRQPQEHQLPVTFAGPSGKGNGNGNYDSNPDDPDPQHMECARSSPSSQLLSSTTANHKGQANQNSVLQTLPQLAHQAPQIRELNNEFLLAYNSLVPNSEFARVHQQMIQERRQQQQLAREEAAKLKERVETALAKAIGWAIAASSRRDLDQADPLPVPKTGGPPEATEAQSRSRSRGLKRSHHGPISGNGNINLIDLNSDSNPDTYVQHRERARSPGSPLPSPTTANPNGQANQNAVLQTINQGSA
jgi:hypothetical protein